MRIPFFSSKKNLIFLVFFLICSPFTIHASSPQNAIMFNAMGLASGNYGPEYEIALSDHFGLGIRANLVLDWEWKGGKNDEPGDDYDWIYKVNGYGAGISARLYPFGHAPRGLHIGPRFDFIGFNGTYEDRAHNEEPCDTNLSLGTAHLELGYKFIIGNAVVIGLFGDAGYAFAEAPDASSLLALLYIVGGGIYVGCAF